MIISPFVRPAERGGSENVFRLEVTHIENPWWLQVLFKPTILIIRKKMCNFVTLINIIAFIIL